MNSNNGAEHGPNGGAGDIPATPQPEAELVPHRIPLVPERSDFLEGDAPAADKVQAFLAQALAATGTDAPTTAGALVPWICDALLSNHSVKAYGRDLMDFLRHMQAQGVSPLHIGEHRTRGVEQNLPPLLVSLVRDMQEVLDAIGLQVSHASPSHG